MREIPGLFKRQHIPHVDVSVRSAVRLSLVPFAVRARYIHQLDLAVSEPIPYIFLVSHDQLDLIYIVYDVEAAVIFKYQSFPLLIIVVDVIAHYTVAVHVHKVSLYVLYDIFVIFRDLFVPVKVGHLHEPYQLFPFGDVAYRAG